MSYDQWQLTIRSKAHSSWNLHRLLPNLDFFIQLSSLAGIVGPAAQSNYAAGCTFQDALARHRIAIGQKAVSLDLGWMVDIGIIAENKAYERYRQDVDDMQKVKSEDLLAVLEIYCDPSLPILPLEKSQLLIGVTTPANRLSRGLAPTPANEQPLFLGFSQIVDAAACPTVGKKASAGTLFRNAKTVEDRAEVVVKALVSRLARALSMSIENMESNKSFSDYGVDSLMAVELRNWIGKEFQANVAVFDIMGGTSIANVGQIIARRSTYGAVE
jgi:acyl carrier protein